MVQVYFEIKQPSCPQKSLALADSTSTDDGTYSSDTSNFLQYVIPSPTEAC